MPFSVSHTQVKCRQAEPSRSHRGLSERFWITDTQMLFQRMYWRTTRRFFHKKPESHWSILSTASEKLAQQYFFGHSHCSFASQKQTTRKTTQKKMSSGDISNSEDSMLEVTGQFFLWPSPELAETFPQLWDPNLFCWRLIRNLPPNPWSEPARNLWKSTKRYNKQKSRNIKIIKQEPPEKYILLRKKCFKELYCLTAQWTSFIFTCPSLIGSLSPGIWILSWRWEFRNVSDVWWVWNSIFSNWQSLVLLRQVHQWAKPRT